MTGRRQAGGMYFAVEDNGMGMTPERLAEVRTSLQNGAPLDPDGKGGYGLRNVEQRLRLYYGCGLTIESEYRHGTRISLYRPDERGGENAMMRVFIADDEEIIRDGIRNCIEKEQERFLFAGEAPDGEMALPMLMEMKPDVLITDIRMPFMDGLTLCKLVKKELPDIKIVILSGYDDFNYAKQAINIGVEDYLLKPITKNAFIERLEEIHNRYEHEKTQKEYYEKFKLEMQEYERNASRDFFESLVRADFDLEEIYRRADRLNLDIVAEAYNILIFTPDASDSSYNSSEGYSDWEAEVHKKIENYFLSHPVAMLFRHQVFSYAILVKGQRDTIKKNTCECVETIQKIMEETRANVDWFVAVGEEADRLSRIKQSYHTAARTYAFRYLYDGHIFITICLSR